MHRIKTPIKPFYALGLALFISAVPGGVYAQSNDNSVSLRNLQGEASVPEDTERQSGQAVDGIAAVVNKNVITLQQLASEVDAMRQQLQFQDIPVPDADVLQRQVLQRMISRELERQEADELEIEVTDEDVEHALSTIAERNNIPRDQLRRSVEESGLVWRLYLEDLRRDIRLEKLRQQVIDVTIDISEAEIDAFLRSEGQRGWQPLQAQPAAEPMAEAEAPPTQSAPPATPQAMGLAHILIAVPEGASASEKQSLRQQAEDIHRRVKQGENFSGVAAAESDGPEALDGGDMGVRPMDGWPDLFIEATQGLSEGDISNIFESGNGFHILQVVVLDTGAPAPAAEQAAPAAPAPQPAAVDQSFESQVAFPDVVGSTEVEQTHARHILIKTSQVMSDEQAQERLSLLRERIQQGEDFETLARRNSEDGTAPQGGDLGWLSPGETVPAFERAMDALQPGDVSQPVKSSFGWHLIQVLERRTKDMEDEYRRMQARQILFERRVEPALEDWLNQLEGQAYIDNRIDPEASSKNR